MIKRALKRLLPPILLDLARDAQGELPTWSGIYQSLRDVPTRDGTFDHRLIGKMASLTKDALKSISIGRLPYTWHEPLALVASLIAAEKGRVRVLDFGGGIGPGYVQLLASLPASTEIEYVVVDLSQMCDAGREVFAADHRIRFMTEIPEIDSRFDIIYANSVLQYIDDYAGVLSRLAALAAPRLLLGQLAAGPVPTYATQQLNVPGQVLPYWFLNVDEVVQILDRSGYECSCRTLMERTFDRSNFPQSHRVERMSNMLFIRRTAPLFHGE